MNLNAKKEVLRWTKTQILLGFLPDESGEIKMDVEDAGLEKKASPYGFTSSEAVPDDTVKF